MCPEWESSFSLSENAVKNKEGRKEILWHWIEVRSNTMKWMDKWKIQETSMVVDDREVRSI